MIQVLFVNHNLVLQSGITTVMKNLIENSIPGIVNYTIVTMEDKRNNVSYFRDLGVNVIIMPRLSIFRVKEFISFFCQLFQKNHFDIVHSHFSQIDRIIFPIARKNGVKKCISHSHSAKLSESRLKALLYKIMCFQLSKKADYCAACSEQAGVALFGSSFPVLKNKLIIKNGIDCSKYAYNEELRQSLRKEYNITANSIVVGHVGRFSVGKNQSFLVKILDELKKRGKDYMLFLVGAGETLNGVEKMVSNLGLNNYVIFAGGRDDIDSILNLFDLFVMPSIHEGLGISAVEAQANGLECVLSSNIPKEADLTGVKFLDLNDPITKWADCIESLSCIRHREYNEMVVNAGYEIINIGASMTNFYKELIDEDA